jgi:biopolymer transport protein ExbD
MWRRVDRIDSDDLVETHEINVTPFIDVMLVLLIIFMVAAPLATVDLPVNLPSSTTQPQPRPDKPIFVTLRADRTLAIGDRPVGPEGIAAALDAASGHDHEQRVYLRADRALPYGDVMEMMNALRAAGYSKVALVALEIKDGT